MREPARSKHLKPMSTRVRAVACDKLVLQAA
jgi:hypothetical protein